MNEVINPIDERIAGQLSDAAYANPLTAYACTADVPTGWSDITSFVRDSKEGMPNFYATDSKNGEPTPENFTNEFRIFENPSSHQIVIVFKGSKQLENFVSDVKPTDQGYSQYLQIKNAAQAYFDEIKENPKYKDYSFFTDGHSLGGGMAQSFAVQNQIDGFGQNSLPIPAEFINKYASKNQGSNFTSDLAAYRANHTFDEVNVAGDIATEFYSTSNHLLGGQYINQNPRTLNSPYAGMQAIEIGLASMFGLPLLGVAAAVGIGMQAHRLKVYDQLIQEQGNYGNWAPLGTGASPDQIAAIADSVVDSNQNADGSISVVAGDTSSNVFVTNPLLDGDFNSGDDAHSILAGADGDDHLAAGSSGGILIGGLGNDVLDAGDGNSTLVGGWGDDTLVGGSGKDLFEYVLPQDGSATTVTIQDQVGDGSIWVGNLETGENTQFDGGKVSPGKSFTWTDEDGATYIYKADVDENLTGTGTLTINKGALGDEGGNQIIVEHFDLNNAETKKDGDIGIKFSEQTAIVAGVGDNPFADGDYAKYDGSVTTTGVVQALTVYASARSDEDQIVKLIITDGATSQFMVDTGNGIVNFINGVATLTIPSGSDSITFGLIYTGEPSQSKSVSLTSILMDTTNGNNSPVAGNTFTLSYDGSKIPELPVTSFSPAGIPISIDPPTVDHIRYQLTNNNDLVLGDGNTPIFVSNTTPGGTLLGGNDSIRGSTNNDAIWTGTGFDIIEGNGGQDFIGGYGGDRLYAGTQVSLSDAVKQGSTGTATGQNGDVIFRYGSSNDIIVGSNGNDAILVGDGDSLIVLGPGNNKVEAGIDFSLSYPQQIDGGYIANDISYWQNVGRNGSHAHSSSSGYEGNTVNDFMVGDGDDTILGGKGNDSLWLSNGSNYVDGGGGGDSIFGGSGSDTIFAGAGDDLVAGGGGDDYIDSGSGNDYIIGEGGNNTLIGGSGNDTIFSGRDGDSWATGESGNNYVQAGSGDTLIYGSGGNDTLIAGGGNDSILAGNGATTIIGGSGVDVLIGGAGRNVIYAGDGGTEESATTIVAGEGDTTVYGGLGIDNIYGGSGENVLYAGDGGTAKKATQITAGDGDTTIYGGMGTDVIFGGVGNNVIYADDGGNANGATKIIAGAGNTTIYGGNGIDQIWAGSGNDLIYTGNGGTSVANTFVMSGEGTTTVVVGSGYNHLVGGGGKTTYVFARGDGGTTLISQPSALDTIQFGADIALDDLSVTTVVDQDGTIDYLIEVTDGHRIYVASGLNTVNLANGITYSIDQLLDMTSSHVYYAENGDVRIDAPDGDATVYGGTGADTIIGGSGNNLLYAGEGGTENAPTVVMAGGGHTTIYGGGGVDFLYGGSGPDTIIAGSGDSYIHTGDGGTTDENTYVYAGSGSDTIVSGNGYATLVSGSGPTVFEFDQGGEGKTVIEDFSQTDTLSFGVGVTPDSLSLTADIDQQGEPALVIKVDGRTIEIDGGLTNLAQIEFADSGAMPLGQVAASASSTPFTYHDDQREIIFDATPSQIIEGTANDNAIFAWGGGDTVLGGANNNLVEIRGGGSQVVVGDGSNTINMWDGRNTVTAGAGDNTFTVHSEDDVIHVTGRGNNEILSSVNYALPENIQNLKGIGSKDIILKGNDLDDVIIANDGNDTLISGTGIDTLIGGVGSDTFIVNDADDVVIAQGNAIVRTSVSYVAPENVITLVGTGTDDIVLSGNDLDTLIVGNGGNDTLISGSGNDTLIGGSGNNTFVINSTSDVVNATYGGVNSVKTTVSYIASKNITDLIGVGNANIVLGGNDLDNLITANAGDDTLIGGLGNDTLVGGIGSDTFVMGFDMGRNTIIDNSSPSAVIQLQVGMSSADLLAKQDGDDLLLEIPGSIASMRLKGYFSSQTQWTIQDSSGNTTTPQSVLEASSDLSYEGYVLRVEEAAVSKAKAKIITEHLALGFSMRQDGSLFMQYFSNGLTAWPTHTEQTITTTTTINHVTTVQVQNISSDEWIEDPYYFAAVHDNNATVDVVDVRSDDAVIYAQLENYYSNQVGPEWVRTTWTTLSSSTPYVISKNQSQQILKDQSGNVIGNEITDSSITTSQSQVVGNVIGVVDDVAGLNTFGPYPDAVLAEHDQTDVEYLIQRIELGSGDHIVYGNDTSLVNAGDGANTIYDAGFVYGGTGSDTMIGGGTLMGGTGNSLMIGGKTMIAGNGSDRMFSDGSHASTFLIDPQNSGIDLIGGVGDTSQFISAYYQSKGIDNVELSYEFGGMYEIIENGFYTKDEAVAELSRWGWTLDQAIQDGRVRYIEPLPVLLTINDQPLHLSDTVSPYYATGNVPEVVVDSSDIQSMSRYYAEGLLFANKVIFGDGITVSGLQLSWGQVTGSLSGYATDNQSIYVTLNISWGEGQGVQIMMPHSSDPIGSGVQEFDFADGSKMSIADLMAMAPPAPSFDPHYTTFEDDGQGNISQEEHLADGTIINASWTYADGSHGSYSVSPDGSSRGESYASDGSSTTYIDDGQGNRTTSELDATGQTKSIVANKADGTSTVQTYIDLPAGVTSQMQYFTAPDGTGTQTKLVITFTDGGSEQQTFAGDGSSDIQVLDAFGNVLSEQMIQIDTDGVIINSVSGIGADIRLENAKITLQENAQASLTGTGNTVAADSHTVVNDTMGSNTVLVYGSNVTVNASSDTINLDANVSLSVNGNNNVLNGGEGDLISLNGSGNVVNAYHNTQITDANGGNTIAAYGDHIQATVSGDVINVGANDTLDVVGSNNTVNGWIGDTLNISGTHNTLTISDGTEVTDAVGGNTIASYENGADINLSISGDTVNVGSNNTLQLHGSHNVINGWVNDVFNVSGDANEIVLSNGTQLTNSGTGSTFINYGDGVQITDADSNNTILDYAPADSHLDVTASGDMIYVNADQTVNVQGASNAIIAGANDVLTLVDTGAGNTVYANAGVTVTVDANSNDLIQSAVNNDILTLANGSINVSGNSGVMSLDAINRIAVNADGSFSVTTRNEDGEVTQSAQFNHDGSFVDTFMNGISGQTTAILTSTGSTSQEQFLSNMLSGYASITEQFSGTNASGNIAGASLLESDGHRFDFTFNYDETGNLTSFAETGTNPDGTSMPTLAADVGVAQLIQAMAGFAPPTAAQGSVLTANQKLANQPLLAAAH